MYGSRPQAPADKRANTLEQLFSHTSGLPLTEDGCMSNPQYTLASCAQQILQKPLIGTPGKVFAYGNNSMQVAGRMAEIAVGQSWDDIFIDEMALPLGLTATDYATASTESGYVRNANPRVPGGVRSTLDDFPVPARTASRRGWITRGVAGVLFVEDQLTAVNAEINDVRSMVNVVTADGNGRRVRQAVPAMRHPAKSDAQPMRTPEPQKRAERGR